MKMSCYRCKKEMEPPLIITSFHEMVSEVLNIDIIHAVGLCPICIKELKNEKTPEK